MRTKSVHYIQFGPAIPVVPVKDFSSLRLDKDGWADLWSICGPSVERNLMKGLPMWLIIAAAYAEGLSHGSEVNKEAIQLYKEVPINGKLARRSKTTVLRNSDQ